MNVEDEVHKLATWLDQQGLLWLRPASGEPDCLVFERRYEQRGHPQIDADDCTGYGFAIAFGAMPDTPWLEALRIRGWATLAASDAIVAIEWLTERLA